MPELARKVGELHALWWENAWLEIAWREHGCEPASLALTIRDGQDRFNRAAKALEADGLDVGLLVAEFEAKGDPEAAEAGYAAMAEKARCVS